MIRFWIITGLFVAGGLGVFYAEWVAGDVSARTTTRLGRDLRLVRRPRRGRRASASPASPPPTPCTFLGARVTALDESEAGDRVERGDAAGDPRRHGATGCGHDRDPARRRRPAWSPRPGWPPTRAAARAGRRAAESRSGARSSWPGGCATRSARRRGSRVTGTNGKTTTVQMLEAMLRAAGLRTRRGRQRRAAAGRGRDGPRAVRRARGRAVQLPAALRVTRSPPQSAAVLNVAEDHLDWYGPTSRVRRRQGPDLPARAARLRLQRRRPGDRGPGPRGRRGRRAHARSGSRSAHPASG